VICYNTLSDEDMRKLCTTFSKVLRYYTTTHEHIIDFKHGVIFYYFPDRQIPKRYPKFTKTQITYDACTDNCDMLMITNNSIKVCKIEHPNIYLECYYRYNRNEILQTIKNISNGECVFYSKFGNLYYLLWKKYYFITDCIDIWLMITHFVKYSKDILGIIMHFMVSTFANNETNNPHLWEPFTPHIDTFRYSV